MMDNIYWKVYTDEQMMNVERAYIRATEMRTLWRLWSTLPKALSSYTAWYRQMQRYRRQASKNGWTVGRGI